MDIGHLNEAFKSFTDASRSLESYYAALQERISYLTKEVEYKNNQLKYALNDAERSREYLNAILYNLEDAVIVINPDNTVRMLNRSAERLLGLDSGSAIGNRFDELNINIMEESSDTFITVRGEKRCCIISRSSILNYEGTLQGNVILIKDITRLRELENQQERNQRLISMGEMAAKLVHEIRNPLCSIELFSSMLENEINDPKLKNLARGISSGINSLNNILTNMLFFARPHKASMSNVRIDRLIEDCILMFSPLMDSRNVRLKKELFECEMSGDAELIKQVLMNIIINAIDSMPEKGDISIIMRSEDGYVIVDIKDNGAGIEKGYLEKIFDPFFSTKDKGTGLGLTIASGIMQSHGGYISVVSEKGNGSIFSLYFPQKEHK